MTRWWLLLLFEMPVLRIVFWLFGLVTWNLVTRKTLSEFGRQYCSLHGNLVLVFLVLDGTGLERGHGACCALQTV